MQLSAPPSRAAVWVNCPGSPRMRQKYPELEQSESPRRDGIAAHVIAAEMVEQLRNPQLDVPTPGDFIGRTVENVHIDEEMYESAMMYATDVAISTLGEPSVETWIERSAIAPGHHVIVDAADFNAVNGVLTVWDFKYGHSPVDVFENWQLVEGAKAYFDKHCEQYAAQPITVRLRIVQPRARHPEGPIREWTIDVAELNRHAEWLRERFALTQSESPECNPGKWCRYCPARRACEALARSVYAVVDHIDSAPTGAELSESMLAAEWRLLEHAEQLVRARKTGIEEQVKHMVLTEKRTVPGVRVEPRVGRLAWTKDTPHAEVIAMGDLMGVDLRNPAELITPTQAKKLGLDEAVISAYSERPANGYSVEVDDGSVVRRWFE